MCIIAGSPVDQVWDGGGGKKERKKKKLDLLIYANKMKNIWEI